MEFVILYLLVNIAAGAAACFFGKKLFYVLLGVLVFIGVFNVALGSTDASPVSLAIGAALGVVAALLSKCAYKAGAFIVGLVSGAALGFIVTMLLPREAADYLGVIMVVTGVLLGLAAVRWADAAVRFGTAWAGSSFLVPNVLATVLAFGQLAACAVPGDALATFDSLTAFVGGDFAAAYATPILVGTIALTVVGSIVQTRTE